MSHQQRQKVEPVDGEGSSSPSVHGAGIKSSKNLVVRLNKLKVDGVSPLQKLYQRGIKAILVEASAPKLFGLITFYYVASGGIIGFILSTTSENDDSDAAQLAHRSDNSPVWLVWWYNGVLLLLLNVTFVPANAFSRAIVIFSTIFGSVIGLCLFGVIYEKFSTRKPSLQVTDVMILRQLPEESPIVQYSGSRPMLTVRLVSLSGEFIVRPALSMACLRRVVLPDGEGFVIQQMMRVDNDQSPGLPTSAFANHVIDEDSPLHAPVTAENLRLASLA